jgi:hypothetical protein
MPTDLRFESQKLLFDLMKHVTTLATGSSLLVIAVVEKMFPNPESIWLVVASLIGFLTALFSSLVTMAAISLNAGKSQADGGVSQEDANVLAWSFAIAAGSFFLGLLAIVWFAIANVL